MDADYVTDYLRDVAKDNIALDAIKQFDEDFIDMIIPMAQTEVTVMYPALSPQDVPDAVLIFGVLSLMMQSESFKELRNQVQYQDANASVALSVKEQNYEQKAQIMKNQFYNMLNALASSKFLKTCWGASRSNSRDMSSNILHGDCYGRY